MATFVGFILSGLSLLVALGFLVLKLTFWYSLPAGYAPAVIGVFFLGSVQIFLIGLLGEYVGAVLTQVRNRPLVTEVKRLGYPAAGVNAVQAPSGLENGFASVCSPLRPPLAPQSPGKNVV